jgi:pseudaminic acid cytidylyltransferase
MPNIAIIPARGGSKRLPRKNIIDFLGRPIIAYTIDAARSSGCFERIVVSTEDDEIADIAGKWGAEIDRRDPALATDKARVTEVCIALLDKEEAAGRVWTHMTCLYATAPLRKVDDIRATVGLLEEGVCDFAMAVTSYDLQPHLALKFRTDHSLAPMWPELTGTRASDLPSLRVSNGSIYAVNVKAFHRHPSFYGPNLRGHDMPRERSIDIDTSEDLALALWTAQRAGLAGRAP